MCGISGVVSADVPTVEPAVRRMMGALTHRGPDGEGFVELPFGFDERGPVLGLGFRRLAILDLSVAGQQPMMNPATGDWLLFNGEVYNFRELKAQLSSAGAAFRSTSDTEVVLHALSRWKEDALPRLQGMFALAFYDASERRLLLARDPLGIKPLYVSQQPDRLVFASEIRGLRASGLVPLDPDVAGIAGMLAYGAVQSPRTIYENIRSFPAGHRQWFDAGIVSGRSPSAPRRFWAFPSEVAAPSAEEAAAEVTRLLRDSVARHLVADVPVGILLSAGIDSTAIAAFGREQSASLMAFTVGFGSLRLDDESPMAAATAAALGIRHVTVEVEPPYLPDLWRDWLATLDSPSIDGFNTWIVSRRLAQEGVVVGLSGLGADELFGGYPSFRRAARWSQLIRTFKLVPPGMRSGMVAQLATLDGRSGIFEKLGDVVATDGSVASITRAMRRALSDRRLAALRLASRRVGLAADYLDPPGPLRDEPPLNGDAFNTVSRLELVHYMGDTLLRDTDATSMQHGLELRVPFLDGPLVNYVSALPGSVKQSLTGPPKALLRAACGSVVPEEIMSRPKTGFTLPIGSWMRRSVRDQCEAAIAVTEQLPFLDGGEVRRLWNEFQAKPAAMHWSRPLALVTLGAHLASPENAPRRTPAAHV
jgi:asparagine synthase (glutamine-hydrolysing)